MHSGIWICFPSQLHLHHMTPHTLASPCLDFKLTFLYLQPHQWTLVRCESNLVGQDQHFILMKCEMRNTSECYLSELFFSVICVLHQDERPIYHQISQWKERCLQHTMFSPTTEPWKMLLPLPGKLCPNPYTTSWTLASMLGSYWPGGGVSI